MTATSCLAPVSWWCSRLFGYTKTLYLARMEEQVSDTLQTVATTSTMDIIQLVGYVLLIFAVGFVTGMISALVWVKNKMKQVKREGK